MAYKLPRTERREFLRSSLLATASGAVLGPRVFGSTPVDNAITRLGAIPSRPFGKTGVTLPILGMGGSAMVERWVASYGVKLLSTDDRVAMVRHAYDQGIRYFDTARVYFESESIMGRGLKGVRDQVFLATKVADARPGSVRQSLETSLRQLDTDYADLVQIHSPAIEAVGFDGAMRMHGELVKLRDEKMCRFIGLTTHVAFETVHKLIATGGFDQVLLAYGYFRKGMDTLLSHRNLEFREMCLTKAAELNMAIVAMKVMGASIFSHNSTQLVADYDAEMRDKLPAAAIRWVLQDQRIALLNIGVSMPEDIDKNRTILQGDLHFTETDRRLLAEFAIRAYEAEAIKTMRIV